MKSKTANKKIEQIPAIDFSKFRGKELAIADGKIVAVGKTSKQVFQKAKKIFPAKPAKDIILLSVPKEEAFIYLL